MLQAQAAGCNKQQERETMANVDFLTVTCDNRDVLEYIKGEDIYKDTLEERAANQIYYEANARWAYNILEDASRKYPEDAISVEALTEAYNYTRKYLMTYKNGEDTLEDIELRYMWEYPNYACFNGTKGIDAIEKTFEDFFAKIDTVKIEKDGNGEYEVDYNEDMVITATLPIGEGRKARATKEGYHITLEALIQKKTIVTETWEELKTAYDIGGLLEMKPEDSLQAVIEKQRIELPF